MGGQKDGVYVKVGGRLWSVVSDTEVIVVRCAPTDAVLHCGGQPMITDPAGAYRLDHGPSEGLDEETAIGKRYAVESGEIEVLITKAGSGTLTLDGSPLLLKQPKLLPASD
jgi:hypothetical protein